MTETFTAPTPHPAEAPQVVQVDREALSRQAANRVAQGFALAAQRLGERGGSDEPLEVLAGGTDQETQAVLEKVYGMYQQPVPPQPEGRDLDSPEQRPPATLSTAIPDGFLNLHRTTSRTGEHIQRLTFTPQPEGTIIKEEPVPTEETVDTITVDEEPTTKEARGRDDEDFIEKQLSIAQGVIDHRIPGRPVRIFGNLPPTPQNEEVLNRFFSAQGAEMPSAATVTETLQKNGSMDIETPEGNVITLWRGDEGALSITERFPNN